MAIQELYNKLRVKREYASDSVALRISTDELDTLLLGLQELGADVNKGYQHLLDFKEESKRQIEASEAREAKLIEAYDALRAKPISGKFKDNVGFIHLLKGYKKPIKLVFPNGDSQVYLPEQINVIDKDRVKLNERMEKILSGETL